MRVKKVKEIVPNSYKQDQKAEAAAFVARPDLTAQCHGTSIRPKLSATSQLLIIKIPALLLVR